MPRQARLDAPGTLHHVIVRGIEKRRIVDDQKDRENFVSRLGEMASATGTTIYAWALMTNHAHILAHSGQSGLPTFMRRLLTGYAMEYPAGAALSGQPARPLSQENEMKRTSRLIFLCMIVLLLSACSERSTAYYPKYEDAVKDRAVERGWIPEIVPKSATEIHEEHDLDTNEVWIRFSTSGSDRNRIRTGLKRLSDDEVLKIKLRYPSKANWWFEDLVQQSPSNDNALNAEIYAVKCVGDGYLAFDRTSQFVYYWCTGRMP